MNTIESLKEISHSHHFDTSNPIAKKNTLYATLLTFVTMIVEIFGGYYYNSMALLADGWHMSSHVLALGMAYMAYVMASKYANDFRFNFGTYKMEVLGGYTSAILLLVVAFFMVFHSVERIFNPVSIAYKEAITIAIVGLIVNLICAWLLKDDHHHNHGHDHHHTHEHGHHHHDMNLKAAYLHVLADALTSVLAIIALTGGMIYGFSWLDPMMGIVGSVLVFVWAVSLIKQSGKILLDAEMDAPIVEEVIEVINALQQNILIEDLHVWRVGKGKFGCILTLNSNDNIEIDDIKKELSIHKELVHISVEIKKP
ncbi:CDF family Co(II)/Ni(II) efflux transporter DmeF [Sulfurovum sp. XGS-02]|uniref:CDF family Co(II)/Ni(II) efflux transporter DmeF n=1 Tax=Sulfurovum sp. XGS-02 TaxID=2925411 RepID=UPI0020453381|nr:CDF family Co(II)/Ni(II) efflux transporter DmeF [Sulfurovum sp. XGS-02]UPT77486.1 CDF family Co(II)/Ni(II) efflux transporter DmeF [Sulfurovum sp. XGS-02]